jgi:hypothetical protein
MSYSNIIRGHNRPFTTVESNMFYKNRYYKSQGGTRLLSGGGQEGDGGQEGGVAGVGPITYDSTNDYKTVFPTIYPSIWKGMTGDPEFVRDLDLHEITALDSALDIPYVATTLTAPPTFTAGIANRRITFTFTKPSGATANPPGTYYEIKQTSPTTKIIAARAASGFILNVENTGTWPTGTYTFTITAKKAPHATYTSATSTPVNVNVP